MWKLKRLNRRLTSEQKSKRREKIEWRKIMSRDRARTRFNGIIFPMTSLLMSFGCSIKQISRFQYVRNPDFVK